MAAPKGNKFAVGNKGGGMHSDYTDPALMQDKIDEYFRIDKVPTVPGLAYHLGFCDKKSLCDYEAKEVFQYSIKRAKLRIETFNAKQLHEKQGNVSGVIFTLKNMGWKDQQDIDLNMDFNTISEESTIMICNELIKRGNNEKK
jgi:hypothetical protein